MDCRGGVYFGIKGSCRGLSIRITAPSHLVVGWVVVIANACVTSNVVFIVIGNGGSELT